MIVHTLLFLVLMLSLPNTQAETVHICDDAAEFAPYIYRSRIEGQDNSQLMGATKEFLDEIFKTIGIDYKLNLLPWKRCLSEVENFGINKKYEVFSNGSYSKERSKKYYITTAIYRTHEGLWYSQNKFPKGLPVNTAKDLNQYSLCGVLGYNYESLADLGVTSEISTGAHTVKSALMLVAKDRCDIFIGGLEDTYGGDAIGTYKIPEYIVGVPFPEAKRPTFHLFISKSSPRAYELHTKLNQAILLLQHTGISQKIYKKYLPDGDGL